MRSQQFYDLALARAYPFDDSATLVADNGTRLPEGLLCDLNCVVDRTIADRVFCSSITKRADFCSVVFSAVNVDSTALALLELDLGLRSTSFAHGESPTTELQSLVDGFSGYAVAGEQWGEIPDGVWRFSTPKQSLLLSRCCWPLALPDRQHIRRMQAIEDLAGDVLIQGQGDINVTLEPRVLGGETKTAVVISLSKLQGDVLGKYAGTYQQRPESRTCGDPAPIETINRVGPNCCGQIFIELRGCAQPVPIRNHCGVVLDCPLTQDEVCPAKPDYGAEDDPDACLEAGQGDPLYGSDTQPSYPTLPPNW